MLGFPAKKLRSLVTATANLRYLPTPVWFLAWTANVQPALSCWRHENENSGVFASWHNGFAPFNLAPTRLTNNNQAAHVPSFKTAKTLGCHQMTEIRLPQLVDTIRATSGAYYKLTILAGGLTRCASDSYRPRAGAMLFTVGSGELDRCSPRQR